MFASSSCSPPAWPCWWLPAVAEGWPSSPDHRCSSADAQGRGWDATRVRRRFLNPSLSSPGSLGAKVYLCGSAAWVLCVSST